MVELKLTRQLEVELRLTRQRVVELRLTRQLVVELRLTRQLMVELRLTSLLEFLRSHLRSFVNVIHNISVLIKKIFVGHGIGEVLRFRSLKFERKNKRCIFLDEKTIVSYKILNRF